MQFLPKTRAAKIRLTILLAVWLVVVVRFLAIPAWRIWSYDPQEGDIVFQSLPRADLVDAIEGVSNSPHSHCGMVMRKNGEWVVVEAIGSVRETPLWQWIIRGRGYSREIYRLKDKSGLDVEKLRTALYQFEGRPYDFHYAMGDTEIYCSELVYKAYDRSHGIKIGEIEKLGSLNWKPFEAFIREMENGELPLDRDMITPVALTRSPLLVQVK